jgi:cysteinyl-tRNA synthetase
MKIYNTLSRKIEIFEPRVPGKVTFYACGPTVYDFTHIGHYRTYVGNDVVQRTLKYLGYDVKYVMNVTDVGHLSDDGDAGEEKMEKGARKYGKTVWDLAKFYTDFFFMANDAFGIYHPDIVCRATQHIPDMINLIQKLQENGYTYETEEAVYYNVVKFRNYEKLFGQNIQEKKKGVREEVVVDPKKKHPADFVLWFKRVGRFKDHTMHWDSPWGDGFPGWHIECSAMSMKYLGSQIDIHAGGVDHISVHHPNEIAQSEAATGRSPFVKYWVHHNFLQVNGQKMSKSLNNFFTIEDIRKKKIDPLAIRLLFLQTNYRKEMNFTWESAYASQESFLRLKNLVLNLLQSESSVSKHKVNTVEDLKMKFVSAVSDDFNMASAVAILWEVIKSDNSNKDKLELLYNFDQILGLGLKNIKSEQLPQEILELAEKRHQAKNNRDFKLADNIRKKLMDKGYIVEDNSDGVRIKKVQESV